MKFDYEFIDKCEKVVVVMMEGWEDSVGIKNEIALAKRIGRPVSFIEYNDLL